MLQTLRTTAIMIALVACNVAWADLELPCQPVTIAPVVDGRGDDPAWSKAPSVSTRDAVAEIDHQLRCTYTSGQVFILVKFPDADENREHKPLIWNPDEKRYVIGPQREDTLVLKWNMEPWFTDISLSADAGYKADIWFWKAVRTDPLGFADDKLHIYSDQPLKKGTPLLSKSDRPFYLVRQGDAGRSAYKLGMLSGFKGDTRPAYTHRRPEGSRADVRARGHWSEGWWTVEFARDLVTGNTDDVQFASTRRYQFGISRYEIAGRRPDPNLQIPLYGSGEVGERLILVFGGEQSARK